MLVVGTLSFVDPWLFQHSTVWSEYGIGYVLIPLFLPVAGPGGSEAPAGERGRRMIVFRDPSEIPSASVARSRRSGSSTACMPVIARCSESAAGRGRARRQVRGGDVRPESAQRAAPRSLPRRARLGGAEDRTALRMRARRGARPDVRRPAGRAHRRRLRRVDPRGRAPRRRRAGRAGLPVRPRRTRHVSPAARIGAEHDFTVDEIDDVLLAGTDRRALLLGARLLAAGDVALAGTAARPTPRGAGRGGARLERGRDSASRPRTCSRPDDMAPPTACTPAGSSTTRRGLRTRPRSPWEPTRRSTTCRSGRSRRTRSSSRLDLYGHE